MFRFPSRVETRGVAPANDPCFASAVAEISRVLKKTGIRTVSTWTTSVGPFFSLFVGLPGTAGQPAGKFPSGLLPDAYTLTVSSRGVLIGAATAKGILNGVYDLAERLGYAFLLPGEAGEWAPERVNPLPVGRTVCNPRFRHRGVYYGGMTHDFTVEQWLEFYAKLRFNAVGLHGPELKEKNLPVRLGLRLETGGHGYRDLLPRKLFQRKPDLFRMGQPEDFGGKRIADYNSCAAHPESRKIIRESFRSQVLEAHSSGCHALHLWPDDLPGGGWCLCPHCRGIAPSDQAMLAMRNLAEVVSQEKLPMRVPMLAYHDTVRPAWDVPPTKETFLLFAARERCYGHRLSDPSCARNRYYMRALAGWMAKYKGIDDAHTFEYYSDQILFRGLHPYIPAVIAGDMEDYQRVGIESHMTLHIAGSAVAPDWNMLFFSRNLWADDLTAQACNASISGSLGSHASAGAWTRYLDSRAEIFTDALRICEHEIPVYLDYRWLPGTAKPFGKIMAGVYRKSSAALAAAAARLEKTVPANAPDRLKRLTAAEVARARFEAAELAVMSHQQDSVNHAMRYLLGNKSAELHAAIASGEKVISAFQPALALAKTAGISRKCWYFRNINRWITKEKRAKIRTWKNSLPKQKNL